MRPLLLTTQALAWLACRALDAIDRRWPCAFPNLTGDDDD